MEPFISDLTKPGEYTYCCVVRRNGLEGRATIRQDALRGNAYVLSAYGHKQKGGRMGHKQQAAADDLALEAKGNLGRALYAARWTSETRRYLGRDEIVWLPPQSF